MKDKIKFTFYGINKDDFFISLFPVLAYDYCKGANRSHTIMLGILCFGLTIEW